MVYGLFLVLLNYIFISIQVLNNWYQSTFLGQRREDLISLFAEFFLGKKKRAVHSRFIYDTL
jgi:hypothetical protein